MEFLRKTNLKFPSTIKKKMYREQLGPDFIVTKAGSIQI